MPTIPKERNNDVPPWLTKTKGTPVNGNKPIDEAIFMNDCAIIIVEKPITNNLLKESGE